MEVQASDMDGQALGEVDLARSLDSRAMVNGELVLAMRPSGSRVALDLSAVATTASRSRTTGR